MSGPDATEHVLGNPDAPVTVIEYGDFECPYCAAAAPVLRRLVEESDGQVRLVFRHFPLADNHPHALTAALAAEAAGAQGAFWPMHDLLFARQDRLSDVALRAYAQELGLDGDRVLGIAAYQRRGDVTDFLHTETDSDSGVPKVGSTLVRAALDDVRAHGGRVIATCPFVRGWIDRHQEYADLLVKAES